MAVITQTVHLNHHNAVTSTVYRSLCGICDFDRPGEWWKYNPDPVLQNENYKVLYYDFNIFTDQVMHAQHSDLVLVNKEINHTFLIYLACYG